MQAPVEAFSGVVAFNSQIAKQPDGSYTGTVPGRPKLTVTGCRDEEDAIRQLHRKMQELVGTGALR